MRYFFILITAGMLIGSCSDNDKVGTEPVATAPELSVSVNNVSIDFTDSTTGKMLHHISFTVRNTGTAAALIDTVGINYVSQAGDSNTIYRPDGIEAHPAKEGTYITNIVRFVPCSGSVESRVYVMLSDSASGFAVDSLVFAGRTCEDGS